MEIPAKAKPLIEVVTIGINARTTIEIEAGLNIEMEGTSAAKLIFSDNGNSTHPRSISSNP